jgi:carboxypeptidase Q
VTVTLKMEAKTLPDARSANVIGEYRGREWPNEVVVIGGHLDSWDVGTGSTDDGGGCVVMMEAVALLKRLDLRPRRTIRVVLWTNEENGSRGATAYATTHKADRHVMAMESDSGVARPLGIGAGASDSLKAEKVRATAREIQALLKGIGIEFVREGGGAADIGPLVAAGVPSVGLVVDDTRYFDVHHTPADTMDKINRNDLTLNVAAAAVIAYIVADMPARLGE